MNFYDKIYEMVKSFKETPEYQEYIELKAKLKQDQVKYSILKEFKDKQREHQIAYINGQEIMKEEQEKMQTLYASVIQDSDSKHLLECEMRLDVLLADMQKIMGEAVKEIVEF